MTQQVQGMQQRVTCSKCGGQCAHGQRFCGACGSSLASYCPTCGAAIAAPSKFCGNCGTSLG
ncbi:MAG: zinc ribbon domain-containing protein [Chloroflexi bacterium]|nr:zinc ribbon domain-containing protein [Chloroflexota bacterium]